MVIIDRCEGLLSSVFLIHGRMRWRSLTWRDVPRWSFEQLGVHSYRSWSWEWLRGSRGSCMQQRKLLRSTPGREARWGLLRKRLHSCAGRANRLARQLQCQNVKIKLCSSAQWENCRISMCSDHHLLPLDRKEVEKKPLAGWDGRVSWNDVGVSSNSIIFSWLQGFKDNWRLEERSCM